jgi:outer membrane protein insertion porin family
MFLKVLGRPYLPVTGSGLACARKPMANITSLTTCLLPSHGWEEKNLPRLPFPFFTPYNPTAAAPVTRSENLLKTTGTSVGLGKRLKWPDDYFSIYVETAYQYYVLDNFSSTFLFSQGQANNLSLSGTFSRNSIDQPIYPRMGSSIAFTAQFTPPYSYFNNDIDYKNAPDNVKYKWIEYHKWKFNSQWYTRIAGDLVLNARLAYGFLGYYNKDIGDSPFERFYMGGDGIAGFTLDGREIIGLRGYANNSLTPRNPNGYVGGTIFEKYTLEMRYPVSLNPQATIFVLGFLEGGDDYLYFKEFNPFRFKRSAGFGIRVFLPIFGLIGVDWGYGFDDVYNYPPGEVNHGQIHFSIGTPLN